MKYLTVFKTEEDYDRAWRGGELHEYNISIIEDSGIVDGGDSGIQFSSDIKWYSPPPPPAELCDVAYWDGSSVKTVSKDKWSSSLGTPVGVVVIPENMLPDGKPRIISLKYVDTSGNTSTSAIGIAWGGYATDTSLTKFAKVPITDNAGSTSSGSNSYGYLPSDSFTGATSYVDSKAKYKETRALIPSPYLGDDKTLNPEYCIAISKNNALGDFNGLSNTQTLVGLGTRYTAANAAYKYNDGASNLQWYLPAMGELGFLMPRFKKINNTITALGGEAVGSSSFWSSSDYSDYRARYLNTSNGFATNKEKDYSYYVRPFALLE